MFASAPAPSGVLLGLPLHLAPSPLLLGGAALGADGRDAFVVPIAPLVGPAVIGAVQALVLDAANAAFATGPATVVVR